MLYKIHKNYEELFAMIAGRDPNNSYLPIPLKNYSLLLLDKIDSTNVEVRVLFQTENLSHPENGTIYLVPIHWLKPLFNV